MSKYFGATRSSIPLLPLGTEIRYHHRAAPARHQRHFEPYEDHPKEKIPRGWKLKQGLYDREYIPNGMGDSIVLSPFEDDYIVVKGEDFEDRCKYLKDLFFNWPQARNSNWATSQYNKTVFVWPAEGSGIIAGVIRKGIGTSSSAYYSRSYYGEGDWEQGYFHCDMYVDLYVVKERYEGMQFVLCPLWGVVDQSADKKIDTETAAIKQLLARIDR